MPSDSTYDVIIIGGGPAGLTCAIFLGRYQRRVLVVDNGRPRNYASRAIHGFLGQHNIAPGELLRKGRHEAIEAGVEICECTADDVQRVGDVFEVMTSSGVMRARRVVLAYGVRDELPDVPGVEDYYGGSIFHCPDCDGYEVRDKMVGVIGWGPAVVGLSLKLTQWTDKLTVLTDGHERDFGEELMSKLLASGIGVKDEKIVRFDPNHGGPSIAGAAIAAVKDGHIKFTPEMYSKTYFEWMNNIHDWCISRQLWWGHRIPAWHCDACGKTTVARENPGACGGCGITDIRQETDVLDTWFSSGLLPFTTLGWPDQTPDLAAYYPTDLLVTGFDILFFWVARMIMLGCHFMLQMPMSDGSKRTLADAVPFKDVYIHALVRDADRQKMSKTKGNVIDPIDIIQRFGTDAVRFTLATMASPGTDIAFSEARTEGNRAFANKIWNAARFILMNVERAKEADYKVTLATDLGAPSSAHQTLRSGEAKVGEAPQDLPDLTPLETRWIFARLSAVCAEVDRALTDYRFDEAAQSVYRFFWNEFCDWYLELVKLRLDFNAEANAESREITAISLAALTGIFEAALRLLSPFMPFLTEEIWHVLYEGAPPAKSIALTRYPQASDFPASALSVAAMDTMQELINTIRGLRKDMSVPEKEATPIALHGNARVSALAEAHSEMLARMARVSAVELSGEALTGENARSTPNFDVAVIYERQIDVAAERERLEKDIAKYEKGLAAAEKQLDNEAFMAKAPTHIVEVLRKQQSETKTVYDKARAALDALPKA